ncbi:hypothetical protein HDU84_005916 [Entophlyctis sp. JEL0112]|nr:hypothetical protein HDU84_005916 [Entophlyctis sp. JEL0112]
MGPRQRSRPASAPQRPRHQQQQQQQKQQQLQQHQLQQQRNNLGQTSDAADGDDDDTVHLSTVSEPPLLSQVSTNAREIPNSTVSSRSVNAASAFAAGPASLISNNINSSVPVTASTIGSTESSWLAGPSDSFVAAQPGNSEPPVATSGTNFSSPASIAHSAIPSTLSDHSSFVSIVQLASQLSHVGLQTRLIKPSDEVFNPNDLRIKQDIIRMIAQYLGDEGFSSAKVTLLDEANVKSTEREDQALDVKRIKKAILGKYGDWPEVDRILVKPIIKNQKAFLFAIYKQQYLEYIEHQELQKAFTHLNKRLKPLEHYQTSPLEFKDLCYLLTSKSVQSVPTFKNWEGIGPSREKLVEQFQTMLNSDSTSKQNPGAFIPPHRLLTLLRQAVAYQVEFSRYHPRITPKVSTLLQNFQSVVIPNSVRRTYLGHNGNVKCANFVGELGLQIVSGSRLWDTETGTCTGIFDEHDATVWDVTSDRAGAVIASASGDGTVKVWDVGKLTCLQTLKVSNSDVYSVQYHPNNNHIASGGYDSAIRLFDVERGVAVKTFAGHSLSVTKAIFSPIGNLIISASKDSTIKFWDIVSGICINTIASHLGEVTSVDISANGTLLLSSSKDNSNRLWDMRAMQSSLRRFKGHQNTSKNFVRASFAGGDALICGGSEGGMLHIWDTEKGTLLSRLSGHGGIAYTAVWNANQSLLCSSSDDRSIKTWWFDPAKPVVSEY